MMGGVYAVRALDALDASCRAFGLTIDAICLESA
jgi:hypothetical protein